MIVHPLTVIDYYNVRLCNNPPAVLVLIGGLIHSHEYSTLMPQIQDIATHKKNSLKQLLILVSRLA